MGLDNGHVIRKMLQKTRSTHNMNTSIDVDLYNDLQKTESKIVPTEAKYNDNSSDVENLIKLREKLTNDIDNLKLKNKSLQNKIIYCLDVLIEQDNDINLTVEI